MMELKYTIERASEYQPLPHHRCLYTPEECAAGSYIVFSNDGDSALCKSMDEVIEWIEHNSWSRGFGDERDAPGGMMTQCASCGKEVQDTGADYQYCAQCNQERLDPSVRPIVWEYIGGRIGSLPNKRGTIEHSLATMAFKIVGYTSVNGITLGVFTREDNGAPMGLIALETADGGLVIVGGRRELCSLLNDSGFSQNPTIANLPMMITSDHPENYDLVVDAIKQQNADSDEGQREGE